MKRKSEVVDVLGKKKEDARGIIRVFVEEPKNLAARLGNRPIMLQAAGRGLYRQVGTRNDDTLYSVRERS